MLFLACLGVLLFVAAMFVVLDYSSAESRRERLIVRMEKTGAVRCEECHGVGKTASAEAAVLGFIVILQCEHCRGHGVIIPAPLPTVGLR
jgi:hypothetical protein